MSGQGDKREEGDIRYVQDDEDPMEIEAGKNSDNIGHDLQEKLRSYSN